MTVCQLVCMYPPVCVAMRALARICIHEFHLCESACVCGCLSVCVNICMHKRAHLCVHCMHYRVYRRLSGWLRVCMCVYGCAPALA